MSPPKTGDGLTPPIDADDPRTSDESGADVGRASPQPVTVEASSDEGKTESAGDKKQASRAASARPANYKWVGSQVRRMYDSVLDEPVPKNFTDLLNQAYDGKKTPEKS